jgi:hypothetical protein
MASYVPIIDPVSENIFFDIILESTYLDHPPELEVIVDNESIGKYVVEQPEFHICFRRVMMFNQPHTLELIRSGKTSDSTQMLHIKTIKLDNIDLKNLVLSRSTFNPEYSKSWASEQVANGVKLENQIPGEMYLGHNGVWRFEFTSPIYKLLVAWTKGTT